MNRRIPTALIVIGLLPIASAAHAQRTTERYIPIGQSPGVSNTLSYIGDLEAVDTQNQTITVRGPDGSQTIHFADDTDIWLDKSPIHQANAVGSVTDLVTGRRVEVKYRDPDTREMADWIKVEIREGE
jgi:hypothetical protein